MSQAFAFKNKWLTLAVAALCSSAAFAAEDRPALSYVANPASNSAAPAVAQAPAVSAPAQVSAPAAPAAPAKTAAVTPQPTKAVSENTEPSVAKETASAAKPNHAHVARKTVHKKVEDKGSAKDVTYSPQSENEITVSDRDLNDFVFSTPISNGPILPAGVPLVGKPIYMANNTQVLLQFQKGFDKTIQMIVETEDGRVHKLYLKPRPVAGVTFRVDGAKERTAGRQTQAAATPDNGGQPGARAEDIELLKHVVRGDIPPDFEAVTLPKPTRFDKFTVVPLAGWSDGTAKRVMVFSLVAAPGQTAVVAPPEFYRDGISAVMLTGDHVSDSSTPQLFVVEEIGNE